MGKEIFTFLFLSVIWMCPALGQGIAQPKAATGDPIPAEESDSPPVKIIQKFYNADSIPIGTYYYTGKELDSTVYIRRNGKKLKVLFEMPEYEGGYDSLKVFFEEEFSKIEKKKEEMNALALVYILLEKGKITDIRIAHRIAYRNHDMNYDRKIREILFKTQGKWIVPESKKQEPILFIYLFTLK